MIPTPSTNSLPTSIALWLRGFLKTKQRGDILFNWGNFNPALPHDCECVRVCFGATLSCPLRFRSLLPYFFVQGNRRLCSRDE